MSKEQLFANVELNEETLQKAIAYLVVENTYMKRRIDDLLQENTEFKLENQRLNNIINQAIQRLDISGDIPAEKYEWVLSTTIYEAREMLKGD